MGYFASFLDADKILKCVGKGKKERGVIRNEGFVDKVENWGLDAMEIHVSLTRFYWSGHLCTLLHLSFTTCPSR